MVSTIGPRTVAYLRGVKLPIGRWRSMRYYVCLFGEKPKSTRVCIHTGRKKKQLVGKVISTGGDCTRCVFGIKLKGIYTGPHVVNQPDYNRDLYVHNYSNNNK